MKLRALILVALLAGCAAKEPAGPVTGISADKAQSLNAPRSPFENSDDPPFTAQTHFAAGQLAESQNQPARAIEQYQKAAQLDPKHLPSLHRLGVLYAHMKDYPKALDAWRRYLKASNNSATGYANLGFCLELAGETAEAEKAYRKAVEKDPKHVAAHVNYGLLLARSGREAEALHQFHAVMTAAEAQYNLGSAYESQGKIDAARHAFQAALRLDPNLTDAATRLAKLK